LCTDIGKYVVHYVYTCVQQLREQRINCVQTLVSILCTDVGKYICVYKLIGIIHIIMLKYSNY